MGATNIGEGATYAPTASGAVRRRVVEPGEFRFAAAYLDHGHINGQTNGLIEAGGTLVAVFDPDPARANAFHQRFPGIRVAEDFGELLDDPSLHMIAAAAVPNRRAEVGQCVLESGKDYFTDKSPFTTLEQLETIRSVVDATDRRYMVYYSERLHNEAAWHAGELIRNGAIGRLLHVLIMAPHRLSKESRPAWFFDKEAYGGILTDIGSHQVEQFLTYAGVNDAAVNFARVANFGHPDKPGFEDFGEMSLTASNGASFYARVDWYTPDGSPVWGDGRAFIVGDRGTMEIRKYVDPARSAPASMIILTDNDSATEIDCQGKVGYPFFGQLILDSLNRTEHAMTQEHVFAAAELSMKAQAIAEIGSMD